MTTKEKVIALLVKERTDARNIAYQFKEDYDSKIKYGLKSLKHHYQKIADVCRQIGNAISGGNALAIHETIEDRIKREYEKELKEFDFDDIIKALEIETKKLEEEHHKNGIDFCDDDEIPDYDYLKSLRAQQTGIEKAIKIIKEKNNVL